MNNPLTIVKDNVFSLSDPEHRSCIITEYSMNHRIMRIQIWYPDNLTFQYLDLWGVQFFSGPTSWNGARFQLASTEDSIRIINTFVNFGDAAQKIDNDIMLEMIERLYKTFTVTSDLGLQILLIAANYKITDV